MANKFTNRIKKAWNSLSRVSGDDESEGLDREKVVVFAISLILAFCLWMIVNLNRDYSIGIELPIEVGNVSSDQALAEELPKTVTASINGSGWNLISMYNDPPQIFIDVSSQEVNLFEQVQRQLGGVSNVTVQTVEPLYLQVRMEPKEEKKVPIRPMVDVSFRNQYGFLRKPKIEPDSVTVRGAASYLEGITSWPTDSLSISEVNENITETLQLKTPSTLVTLSETSVEYQAEVVQFTEGEVSVPVETRNFPVGAMLRFSPSSIDVRYRVPLQKYASFQQGQTFTAYVDYEQIRQDTTGFVTPQIENVSGDSSITIRSVQPREVGYFTIIGN